MRGKGISVTNGLPALRHFLVQRYAYLKRSLTHKLGCEDLAGDALHETWLRLQRDDVADVVKNPQAYLTTMAVNLSIDVMRSQSQILSMDEVDALLERVPDTAPAPEKIVEDKSQLAALQEIIAGMPKRRREILILVRWELWPQKEVAAHLGISLRVVEYELKAAQEYCAMRLSQRNEGK